MVYEPLFIFLPKFNVWTSLFDLSVKRVIDEDFDITFFQWALQITVATCIFFFFYLLIFKHTILTSVLCLCS